jgi:hypothetical protein
MLFRPVQQAVSINVILNIMQLFMPVLRSTTSLHYVFFAYLSPYYENVIRFKL